MPGPLTSAAASRLKWIKQRPHLPGWWTALQVLLGVAFFFYLAYQLITGGSTGQDSSAAPGRDLGHGVSAPDSGGTGGSVLTRDDIARIDAALPQLDDNGKPVDGQKAPAGTGAGNGSSGSGSGGGRPSTTGGGAASPDTGPKVSLFDAAGRTVQVPAAAADVARHAMRAAFDPAALAGLPLAAGVTPTAPSQVYTDPEVGPLTVLSHSDDTVVFVAKVDPDGTQRFLVDTQAAVTREGGSWVYTNARS